MSKADALNDFRKDAKKIGRQNRETLLIWLHKWGWTNGEIIRKLLGVKRKIEYQYVRNGTIEKLDIGPGYGPVFVLSRNTAPQARELYENMFYEMDEEPPFLEYKHYVSTNFPRSLYNHTLTAQSISLDYDDESVENILYALETEREISARGGIENSARPDFVIKGDGFITWHEIELNGKYKENLIFQLFKRAQALKQKKYDRLIFHCGSRGIMMNIRNALKEPMLPWAAKEKNGRVVLKTAFEHWGTRDLREACDLLLLGQPSQQQQLALMVIDDL